MVPKHQNLNANSHGEHTHEEGYLRGETDRVNFAIQRVPNVGSFDA